MELEFHAIFLFLKFDRPIPIVVFREPYNGILEHADFFKFDRSIRSRIVVF